jgi:hypothetical protein
VSLMDLPTPMKRRPTMSGAWTTLGGANYKQPPN